MIHGVEAVECQQGRCIVREQLPLRLVRFLKLIVLPSSVSCVPGLVVSADSAACTL